jgi:hypothetical protein
MGTEDSQVQKQRDALALSKSVVQRPAPSNLQSTSRPLDLTVGEFITYPEFAPSQTSLPPLVTLRRLLLVLYLTAGATATIYLVAKLLIQPLLRRVVSARRDFQQHVLIKITQLAQDLSENLPAVPLDKDSSIEPPSETIPDKLTELSTMLTALVASGETVAHNELSFATEDLLVYLNNQIYTSAPFGGYGFNATSDDAKNDIINRVKTDIRSVKGAVLNMYFCTKLRLY